MPNSPSYTHPSLTPYTSKKQRPRNERYTLGFNFGDTVLELQASRVVFEILTVLINVLGLELVLEVLLQQVLGFTVQSAQQQGDILKELAL